MPFKSPHRENKGQSKEEIPPKMGEPVNLLGLFTGAGLKGNYISESPSQHEQWNTKAGTLNLIAQVKDCS